MSLPTRQYGDETITLPPYANVAFAPWKDGEHLPPGFQVATERDMKTVGDLKASLPW